MPSTTWLDVAHDSLFSIDNLPYAVAAAPGGPPRVVARIGDWAVNLAALAQSGLLPESSSGEFARPSLNSFLAGGRAHWSEVRARLQELLSDSRHESAVEAALLSLDTVELLLPFEVGDYVDFYSSLEHASNLGRLFRPDSEPLLPNWRQLPVGYHGRSGTVVVSGTPVVRPCGQRRGDNGPVFGPSVRLDIEAEVGFVVGVPSELGSPVPVSAFEDHVFGVVLVNDWSARDIQAWEYQPLGPFLGKSFATSVAAWVTPLEALSEARVAPPVQDPEPLEYLRGGANGFDLAMSVTLNGEEISRPPFAGLYWTPAQQLAHMTVNGASVRTGDLYASGTVSGPEPDQRGSFIELTWGGAQPLALRDGSSRTFLEDGDTIEIAATAPGPGGIRIGLGSVRGTVRPARRGA